MAKGKARKVSKKKEEKNLEIETNKVQCPDCGYINEIRKGFTHRVCDRCNETFTIIEGKKEKEIKSIIVYYNGTDRKIESYDSKDYIIEIGKNGISIDERNQQTLIPMHNVAKVIVTYKHHKE